MLETGIAFPCCKYTISIGKKQDEPGRMWYFLSGVGANQFFGASCPICIFAAAVKIPSFGNS